MGSQAATEQAIRVGPLEQLRARGVAVVHAEGRAIAVFAADGRVFAVDNRCPHMGFPLHKGTVKDGLLTCHWHQARFDLASGCTFDLFADDVPTYRTEVVGGEVLVWPTPRRTPDAEFHRARLRRGLEQSISLIQAKGLIGLQRAGQSVVDLVGQVARFGSVNHDNWQSGMTLLAIVANLGGRLDESTAYYALCRATRQVAGDCDGQPARRPRQPLDTDAHELGTLKRWLRQWTLARHRDGAERVLLTALAAGASPADLTDLICSAINDRVFPGQGHIFDFANKAIELLGHVGWEQADTIVPLLARSLVGGRGAEEDAHWHHPSEIIEPLRRVEGELPDLLAGGAGRSSVAPGVPSGLTDTLLGDDPLAILDALRAGLADGCAPADLARQVAYCAALRLARFSLSNDVMDWFNPQHTFTYANAVCQAVGRSPTPGVVRAVFHAALAVYMDRFLNVPPARLPGERRGQGSPTAKQCGRGPLDDLPDDGPTLRARLLEQLDQRSDPDRAARLVARYVRLGLPVEPLIDTLVFATVREDVDFHPMQVLEAGVRQYQAWTDPAAPPPSPGAGAAAQRAGPGVSRGPAAAEGGPGEHILVGVARQLAAFCPTRRAAHQTATIALRLHRGDILYEEEASPG